MTKDERCPACGERVPDDGSHKYNMNMKLVFCPRSFRLAIERGERIKELERGLRIIEGWAITATDLAPTWPRDRIQEEFGLIGRMAREALYPDTAALLGDEEEGDT